MPYAPERERPCPANASASPPVNRPDTITAAPAKAPHPHDLVQTRSARDHQRHRKNRRHRGLWVRCDSCHKIIWKADLDANLQVCPHCGHHFRISARARIDLLLEPGYQLVDTDLRSTDPLDFTDLKPYKRRLAEAQRKTGLNDAILNALGDLGPPPSSSLNGLVPVDATHTQNGVTPTAAEALASSTQNSVIPTGAAGAPERPAAPSQNSVILSAVEGPASAPAQSQSEPPAASARPAITPVVLSVMEYGFIGGSMGAVVGETIARAADRALETRTPLVIVSASGGARMMEGIASLMQLAKVSAVLARLQDERIPFLSLMTDPTTGGVTASFAMLGDLNLAEPGALIGFAGPRVIEQTIRQKLPPGFQRSEFLLEHGFLDAIIPRKNLKSYLAQTLHWMQHRP